MKMNLKRTPLLLLLAALSLGLPARAAETPAAIEVQAEAEAEKAEAKLQATLDKAQAELERAQTELEKAQAKMERRNGKLEQAVDQAFNHRGGHGEPTVQVGQSIHVKTNETVQDLVVVLGDAVVDGTVEGNLVVVLGKAIVNGKVVGNAVNVGQGLTLGPDAVIGGDAVGVLGGVERAPGAKVGGEMVPVKLGDLGDFTVPHWVELTFTQCVLKGRPLSFAVGWVWVAAAVFLLGYLLLLALFPKPVATTAQMLEERGATSFLMGLLALPLLAFFALLLAATGVGLVVVPFLFAAFFFAVLFGKASLLRHLGGALLGLFKVKGTPLLALLVGGVLVSLLYLIPFVGLLAWAVLTMWGLGAALLVFFGSFRKERPPAPAAPTAGWMPPASAAPSVAVAGAPFAAVAAAASGVPETPSTGAAPGFAASPDGSRPPSVPGSASAPMAAAGVAEVFSLPRVGFGRRFWATGLDWVLLAFVMHGPILGWLPNHNLLQGLLFLAYFIGFYVWKSATLGGLVLGLKVVRLDGRRMDFACALVRALSAVFSGIAAGLGYFWCAWDLEKQTWHDKLAGTVVVRVEKVQSLV